MDSSCELKKMKVGVDRLSDLPEGLIHKILSFIGTKQVVQTSALSSRWRYTWTSMPYLDFSSDYFSKLPIFSKFVTHVLSVRNNEVEVSSLKLTFRGKFSQVFVKRVVNYAVSHNVQQMTITCLLEKDIEIPLSLFNSPSVKYLSLTTKYCRSGSWIRYSRVYTNPTSTWELPALSTLDLHCVTLCDDYNEKCIGFISKCANLKNLKLNNYRTMGSDGFTICHPRLSSLTLENGQWCVKAVNVVAPLENLIIKTSQNECQYSVSAPDLTTLVYKGYVPLHLNTDGFHLLEKADLCVSSPCSSDAHKIVCLLEQLHNVKSLTLNLEVVELLSSSMELISDQPSPFPNLKNLSIYPGRVSERDLSQENVNISTVVNKYLLDGCPGANITMVSREDIAAVKNARKARYYMTKLRVYLEENKADIKTNRAQIDQGKAPMENHNPTLDGNGTPQPEKHIQLQFRENMNRVESSWDDLNLMIKETTLKANYIINDLRIIEELLAKLPASNRDMIQPCFSSLCTEAEILMNAMTDNVRIQCDENQSRLRVCFHDGATTLQPSS